MRPARRLPALAAAGAALALLVGCSGSSGDAEAAPSPTGPDTKAAALVRAAAAETEEQKSARYTLTTATTVNGAEVVFAGEGVLDWAADKGETTYDVPGGQVNQRMLGPRLYLALPQQPGVFFELETSDAASSPVGGAVDPTAQLHLLAAVAEVEAVGEEDVRGESTTHYSGTYDVARALAAANDPLQRAALTSLLGAGSRLSEAPYDVFLDRDGRLRRLQQTIEVPAGGDTGGKELSVTTTLEMYEFGVEVTVAAPPKGSVRDGAPILAALRKALPQPTLPASPRAAPPAPVPSSAAPKPPAEPASKPAATPAAGERTLPAR